MKPSSCFPRYQRETLNQLRMHCKYICLLIVCLLLLDLPATAQSLLTGRVVDAEDHTPLIGALVLLFLIGLIKRA